MFYAFIFSLLTPLFAADAPKTDISNAIASYQLRSNYNNLNGAFITSIMEAHENAFPGAFDKHNSLYYYTPLERLSFIQQGLVASILQTPKAMADFEARLPMADITVTVQKPLSIETKELTSFRWGSFRYELANHLRSESGWRNSVEKALKNSLEIWEKEAKEYLLKDSSKKSLQQKAVNYVMLKSLVKYNPGLSYYDLIRKIEDLSVSALDYLEDELNYVPMLDYTAGAAMGEDVRSGIKLVMKEAHAKIMEHIYSSGSKVNLKRGDKITIREVHPNIAIFRGYIGNDCSTSFSPGFVFTPYDRYFYVFDKDNEVLGYVGISMVQIKKQNAVFLHTIQGPGFTEGHVEMVMRGLAKSLHAFNATQIVLADDSNISSNVNFEPIRKTMHAAVAGVEKQDVEWLDREYRDYIAFWDSTMTYDDPNRNRTGRALAYKEDILKVDVKQTPFKAEFTKPPTEDIKKIYCELKLNSKYSSSSYESLD